MQRSGIEGNGHEERGAVKRVVRAGQSGADGAASNRTAARSLDATKWNRGPRRQARSAVDRVVRAGQSGADGTASNRTAPCQLSAR